MQYDQYKRYGMSVEQSTSQAPGYQPPSVEEDMDEFVPAVFVPQEGAA